MTMETLDEMCIYKYTHITHKVERLSAHHFLQQIHSLIKKIHREKNSEEGASTPYYFGCTVCVDTSRGCCSLVTFIFRQKKIKSLR